MCHDVTHLHLETSRLILRPVDRGDARATAELVTPDIAENLLTWPSPMSEEQALAKIDAAQIGLERRSDVNFAILRKADLRLLGWMGLARVEQGQARLGYWLGAPYRGAGFTKEAAPAAIAAATDLLGLRSVIAFVRKSNGASIAILNTLGFALAGEENLFFQFKGAHESCLRYELKVGGDSETTAS